MAAAATLSPALADGATAPIPKAVIYPGDIIRDGALVDAAIDGEDADPNAVILDRAAAVGKMALRTLLPGQLIPVTAVGTPRLVHNGAAVMLYFAEGGIEITATGSALQDGAFGDLIHVRNDDSGLTVSGVVQADGSVRIGGG